MALMVLLFPLFVLYYNGESPLYAQQSLCPFKMLTGFPCPGCGITKSMISFYQGYWMQSCRYHVFGPFVLVFCTCVIVLLLFEITTQKDFLKHFFYSKKIAFALGISLAAYHTIRIVFFILHHNMTEILKESVWQ